MLKCICMLLKILGGYFNNIIVLICLLYKNYIMMIKINKFFKFVVFNVNKDEIIVIIYNFFDIFCIVRIILIFLYCVMIFLKVLVDLI